MPKGMYPGLSGTQLAEQSKAVSALVALANRLMHSEVLLTGMEQADGTMSVQYEVNTEKGEGS